MRSTSRSRRCRVVALLVGLTVASACGHPDGAPCTLRAGTFRAVFTQTGGTCVGAIGSTTTVLTASGGPPGFGAGSDCSGRATITPDMCNADFDRTCTVYDTDGTTVLGTIEFRGATTIVNAQEAEGSVTMFKDGPGSASDCVGMYDVTWTRL